MRGPALLLAALLALPAAAEVPEPQGYRMEDYRAPVPATLAGAEVVDTRAAHALWQEGALFVDVMPRTPKPKSLPADTLWIDKPRYSIPGAHWLPNTGYGALPPHMERHFRESLLALVEGDRSRQVVIFCLEECWMSWNAAKRAVTEHGYTAILWYPGGTDDWAAAGHPLEEVEPLPVAEE